MGLWDALKGGVGQFAEDAGKVVDQVEGAVGVDVGGAVDSAAGIAGEVTDKVAGFTLPDFSEGLGDINPVDANKMAQSALSALDYDPNGIDGALGRGAKGAWGEFCQDRGIDVKKIPLAMDGVVNPAALEHLKTEIVKMPDLQAKLEKLASGDINTQTVATGISALVSGQTPDWNNFDPKIISGVSSQIEDLKSQLPDINGGLKSVWDKVKEMAPELPPPSSEAIPERAFDPLNID